MPTPCRSAGSVPMAGSSGRRPRRPPPARAMPPLPAPVTTFDTGEGGADTQTVAQLIETAVPSYLSIEALVELACRSQRGADWREMYTLVHRQLVSMRLLPPHSDRLDPLRHMYQKMFADLLVAAHRASLPGPLTDAPLLEPAPSEPSPPLLQPSRYSTEFEEISLLGSGGFAVVSRCRSLVDQQEYAVKRIPFRCRTAAAAERTLREVTVLASLDHPNIVKYNTAWLEAGGPRPTGSEGEWTEEQGDTEGDTTAADTAASGGPSKGTSKGSLVSVSALNGRPAPPTTDSSTGLVVMWERDGDEEGECRTGERDATTSNGDVTAGDGNSCALSSEDSSSAIVFTCGDTERQGKSGRADSSESGTSRSANGRTAKTETETTGSRADTSAASMSLSDLGRALRERRMGCDCAVLTAGAFGPRPAGGAHVGGRFWASGGSSSGSTSASSAAAWHVPVARSKSAASAKAAAAEACSSVLPRYRRTVSAPATSAGWLTLYIQMQPCERTLKDWLHERNLAPPPPGAEGDRLACVDAEGCRRLLRDVLLGLHFIHQRGIIHRDLKPANIFLAFSGRAMIGDFGLARVRAASPCGGGGGGVGGGGGQKRSPEQTGGVGTATYASPEQAAGGDYDQSTDLYSLGIVLYELYAPFGTAMERGAELRRLRHERRCAADVSARWPAVAEAVLALTEERRALRPCAGHLLTSPLFSSTADRLLQLEATAAHQAQLLEARAARSRQLQLQLDSCRHEAAVTARLLRNSCGQLRRQLSERDRELERLRALLQLHGIKPPP